MLVVRRCEMNKWLKSFITGCLLGRERKMKTKKHMAREYIDYGNQLLYIRVRDRG
jgi:hypothetical protein